MSPLKKYDWEITHLASTTAIIAVLAVVTHLTGTPRIKTPNGWNAAATGPKSTSSSPSVPAQPSSLSDHPAQNYTQGTAEQPHGTSFGEEQSANILVACAYGLHDADLPSAFQNSHGQRIHDSNGCDRQRQAAKNEQEHVQDFEKPLHALAGIKDRKRIEAELLDRFLDLPDFAGPAHARNQS